MSEMRPCGSQAISDLVVFGRKEGRPYNDLVYTFLPRVPGLPPKSSSSLWCLCGISWLRSWISTTNIFMFMDLS
ncbi:hypothetical protein TorRG33x02_086460 [Trema orientale]|uniref:Uncharacterized protein n=1 Tax=Trema orientale TaxID=63057 RepID=A0A2P5FCI3_TREOI|nr:hypothetical protein TorRG33x02_086460 [Trema orientale]